MSIPRLTGKTTRAPGRLPGLAFEGNQRAGLISAEAWMAVGFQGIGGENFSAISQLASAGPWTTSQPSTDASEIK